MSRIDIVGQNGNDGLHYELTKKVEMAKQYMTKEEIEMLNRLLDSYILASNNDGFKKNK